MKLTALIEREGDGYPVQQVVHREMEGRAHHTGSKATGAGDPIEEAIGDRRARRSISNTQSRTSRLTRWKLCSLDLIDAGKKSQATFFLKKAMVRSHDSFAAAS